MPHLVIKRSDIPASTLQVLDLESHTVYRNDAHDPQGQTKYVGPVVNDTVALSTSGTTITLHAEAKGLAAWFVTNIPNGAVALTAAQANADAAAVLALAGYGTTSAATALDVASVTAAITGTMTAALLPSMLQVMAGRGYTVPAGTQVETAGAFAVSPAVGASGGPSFDAFRLTYDTSALRLSFEGGSLSKYTASSFEYRGATGQAIVVYNDDGTLYV